MVTSSVMKDLNTSYKLVWQPLVGQMNSISLVVRICYLVDVYLENTDVSSVRPTLKSNLLNSPYTDLNNRKEI